MQDRLCFPWMTLGICVAAALVMLLLSELHAVCIYDRQELLSGEWWRIFTGHLAHWSLSHLGWDVLCVLVLGAWCEVQHQRQTLKIYVYASVFISMILLLFESELFYYCGLSGIATALLACAARSAWVREDMLERLVLSFLFIFVLVKVVVFEMLLGMTLFADMDGIPGVPLAHISGLLAAFIFFHPGKVAKKTDAVMVDALSA